MEFVKVRLAEPRDVTELAVMRHALWPEESADEHARDVAPLLAGKAPGYLPAVVLLAEEPETGLVGFIEVGLRSHADGCNTAHPVGFVEGWFVTQARRGRKIGTRLLAAAEDWARGQGCIEMASDTWLDNPDSQRAHEALGFAEVDRCIHYRKLLGGEI